jgi:anti-sigma regulatory factor (Ser/Thr protein kinase)
VEATISLPAEPASAAQARRWLRPLVAGSARPECEDAALLCLSELVANVARHADSKAFTVTVVESADELFIEVSDEDHHMGPVGEGVGPEDETGRGLGIVAALARDWGIRLHPDDGKAVWLRL